MIPMVDLALIHHGVGNIMQMVKRLSIMMTLH
nr:MAG TPA: hypothetical protein [Caudoviricetes sp.]